MRTLFLSCLFFHTAVFAQPSKIDSLRKALAFSKMTNQRVLILSQLSSQYVKNKSIDSCFLLANQALQLAQKTGFKEGEAESLHALGRCYNTKSEYKISLSCYQRALQICKNRSYYGSKPYKESNLQVAICRELAGLYEAYNVDSSLFYRKKLLSLTQQFKLSVLEANTILDMGHSYFNNGQYADALDCYFKSSEIRKKNHDKNPISGPYRAIGYLYVTLGEFQKAKSYLFQAKKAKEKNNEGTYYELAHLSNAYEGLNQLDSALYYAQAALESAQNRKVNHELGYIFTTYAKANERLGNNTIALNWYHQGINICKKQNNLKTLSFAYCEVAKLYYQLGQIDSSFYCANQSINFALAFGGLPRVWQSSEILAKVYKSQQKSDSALKYQEKMIAVKDSLFRLDKIQRVQIIEIEKQQQEKEIIAAKEQRNLMVISTLLVFIVGITFILYRNKSLKKQNTDLQAALLEGQTTERQRLAADLHDNLGSTLTAVRWNLMALNKNNLNESEHKIYDDILTMTTSAHDQIRLISHNLLPEELEKEGLICALERLVRKFNCSGTTHFKLEIVGVSERLSRKMEFELYSIILELTHNITKHSGATEATVALKVDNEKLKVSVRDNGKGLDENRQNGMGIQNVRSRISSLNGQWKMHSAAGKGVMFEAEF